MYRSKYKSTSMSPRRPSKLYITFAFYFLVIMFRLRCSFDKKTGIVFNCFTKDQIWACPNNGPKIGIPMLKTASINPLHVF